MEAFLRDLRYGIRMLLKHPGFTTVAVLVLALGIGANSAIFSIVNEIFLRPLPLVKDPERLVALGRRQDGRGFEGFSHPAYIEYRDQSQVFTGLIAYRGASLNLSSGGQAERIDGALVSGNYFSILGIGTVRGRTFLPEEDQTPGAHPVAIISHGLWKRRFGSDPDLVGKGLILNGRSFTVAGIAPEGFRVFGEATEIWIPLMMEAQARPLFPVLNSRLFSVLNVAGRLKSGVSLAQAQAEMSLLARRLEPVDPKTGKQKQVVLVSNLRLPDPEWRAEARNYLALLMAIVGIVLLIACANVANLLLARASVRRREIAIRLALGASRVRLIRQLLTESILLSLFGGVVGLLLALWTTYLLSAFWLSEFDLSLDVRVLVFTLLLSLLTGVLFGSAPALQASKPDLVPALKDASADRGYRRSHLRDLLVIAQVASSLVLLIGAGLFVRTLQKLQSIDPGFETKGRLILSLDLRVQGYSESKAKRFYQQLRERVEALPGVQSTSLAATLPISTWLWGTRDVLLEGQEPSPDGRGIPVDHNEVEPRYFELLGIPLLRGRDFAQQDREGALQVAIINETMARRYWPGEDPIGKRFRVIQFMGLSPYLQVIGVVKDTRYHLLEERVRPHIYLPLAQNFEWDALLYIRTAGDPKALLATVRREVQALDKDLPVFNATTLTQRLADSFSDQRTTATLVGLFGLLAFVLAAVGLYGVLSYAVSQRTREIGIRMALGAQRRDVLKLVVRQGLLLTLVGVAIGLTAALALTRIVASRLYGVRATDPATFIGAAALLAAVALVASYIPARRASKVDPMTALRYE